MSELKEIKVVDVVGGGFCTASEDGQKVHDVLAAALREGKRACLSFENVEDLTSAFLNTAIGQLYGEFSAEQIKALLLAPLHASQDNLVLLKRVVDRAKEFFKSPERFENATKEALGEDDDQDEG